MLQIPLHPDTEQTLRERAKANGEDVAAYVARLIQQALTAPSVGRNDKQGKLSPREHAGRL
jgi:hypothetical protein